MMWRRVVADGEQRVEQLIGSENRKLPSSRHSILSPPVTGV